MNASIFIAPSETIRGGLKKLDLSAEKVLLVVDKGRLIGTLSDGDLRRGLLKGLGMDDSIEGIFNPHPTTLRKGQFSDHQVKELMLEKQINLIPVVDDKGVVDHYLTWNTVFAESGSLTHTISHGSLDLPVVIMAGGKGTRLAPFTNVLPKPLIPIGDKTILERIIESFREFAIRKFLLTVNYRGEMIRAYFDGLEKDYMVDYLWEKEFCGTAGSLRLASEQLSGTFIVSNCDIIVKADFADVVRCHKESGAWLTVVSSIQHHKFPYGVIDFKEGGEVTGIREKPEFSFPINTGVYVLESDCIALIPEGEVFHMTHLIEELLRQKKKVLTYPVNEGSFIDIGQWEEYEKAMEKINRGQI